MTAPRIEPLAGSLAAIDIGTNSIHLAIGRIREGGALEILDREKAAVSLGAGAMRRNRLRAETIDAAVLTLERFRKIAEASRVFDIAALATSAVRESANAEVFLDAAKTRAGVSIEVVSGEEEARLIALAVHRVLPPRTAPILVLDLGGGSLELAVVSPEGEILRVESIPIGVRRLTERFLRHDPPRRREVAALRAFVKRETKGLKKKIGLPAAGSTYGTSGTFAALAALASRKKGPLEKKREPAASIGRPLGPPPVPADHLEQIADQLAGTSRAALVRDLGLDPDRSETIVAGALVVDTLFKKLGLPSFRPSGESLREGILVDRLIGHHAHSTGPERRKSVEQLMTRLGVERLHAEKVTSLVLSIFDQTHALHGLGSAEREWLETAALLHDGGYHIAYEKHHKHSYYLIRHSALPGFEDEELEVVANVARYHRKSAPSEKHANFRALEAHHRTVVTKLSALLRIADGLDRRHRGIVRSVQVRLGTARIRFLIAAAAGADLEIWAATQKADLFEELFRREVRIRLEKPSPS